MRPRPVPVERAVPEAAGSGPRSARGRNGALTRDRVPPGARDLRRARPVAPGVALRAAIVALSDRGEGGHRGLRTEGTPSRSPPRTGWPGPDPSEDSQ